MEGQVEPLLGGDDLIRVLNESVSVSEYVAEKLAAINDVNEQLEIARVRYSAVASRATTLYFVLSDLRKINTMYSFSLTWYREMFKRAIELTNIVRPEVDQLRLDNTRGFMGQEVDQKQLNRRDRIDLLIATVTQEVFRRVQYAIYYEDRAMVEHMVAIEILQRE